MPDHRFYPNTHRCAWCENVWTGRVWQPERRHSGPVLYTHGICEGCLAVHFQGSRERARSSPWTGTQRPDAGKDRPS